MKTDNAGAAKQYRNEVYIEINSAKLTVDRKSFTKTASEKQQLKEAKASWRKKQQQA